jgi:hypothetical protein
LLKERGVDGRGECVGHGSAVKWRPYEGTIECWWDDAREMVSLFGTAEAKVLRCETMDYQKPFIDFGGSTAFSPKA